MGAWHRPPRARRVSWGLGVLFLFGLGQTFGAAEPGPERVREEKVGPFFGSDLCLDVSQGALHLIYATRKGEKFLVVLDGEPGPEYDEILTCTPLFSPDGKRFAYGARKGAKWRMVVDGQPGPEYDGLAEAHRAFSPDSKRFAYAAQTGEKWRLVVEAQPGPECDSIHGHPLFGVRLDRFPHLQSRWQPYGLPGSQGDRGQS